MFRAYVSHDLARRQELVNPAAVDVLVALAHLSPFADALRRARAVVTDSILGGNNEDLCRETKDSK